MDHWHKPHSDPSPSARYKIKPQSSQTQILLDFNEHSQLKSPAGFTYEPYKHPESSTESPSKIQFNLKDVDDEVALNDTSETYNGVKYPMRFHDQQTFSFGRGSSVYGSQELSAAAQRYSPMETLSPTSPYAPTHQKQNQARPHQSPTRVNDYSSPISPYTSRQYTRQIPAVSSKPPKNESYSPSSNSQFNSVLAYEPKSPHQPIALAPLGPSDRGLVPQFTKIRCITDLEPKVNSQPAFRRANPEGGFISVSLKMSPDQYMNTNYKLSHYKLLQVICHQHIVFAIPILNTNLLEIHVEY